MQNTKNRTTHYYNPYGKRVFDLVLSIILLFFLLPLFAVLSVLIRLDSEGPILFKQQRVGKNGKVFELYKFRTMGKHASENGPSVTSLNDRRITKMGRLLRKYKLDEIPQLLNVVKGDMSIVGPRPEIRKYVDAFKEDYSSILEITPGLTDYAAIRYRNEEEILDDYDDVEEAYLRVILPEKITLYKKYIDEMGFAADMKILFRTLLEVVKN